MAIEQNNNIMRPTIKQSIVNNTVRRLNPNTKEDATKTTKVMKKSKSMALVMYDNFGDMA